PCDRHMRYNPLCPYSSSQSSSPLSSSPHYFFFLLMIPPPPRSTLFPYTTLFRSAGHGGGIEDEIPTDEREGGLLRQDAHGGERRSEEHTSELQSPCNLVCRLLLEKKKMRVDSALLPVTAAADSVKGHQLYNNASL